MIFEKQNIFLRFIHSQGQGTLLVGLSSLSQFENLPRDHPGLVKQSLLHNLGPEALLLPQLKVGT